jgi:hypothetical protein
LVIVQPEAPVAELALILKPLAVIDAVPALLVEEVADQFPAAVALAVAPTETLRISAPLPRSVIVSVPAATTKVSFPVPPVIESLPLPPRRTSFPSEALSVSSESNARTNSFAALPDKLSPLFVPRTSW